VPPGPTATGSLWVAARDEPSYPPLDRDLDVDVCVLGGGIVGAVAALLAQREGLTVALVEASRVGQGVTGYSTAKLAALQGLVYEGLERAWGTGPARMYARVNRDGIERAFSIAGELGIDCHLRRKPSIVYVEDEGMRGQVEAEVEAGRRAGLATRLVTETDLPYPIAAAVRLDDEAEFNSYAFTAGVVRAFADAGGLVFEGTRATSLAEGEPVRVGTTGGTVSAGHVVVATHVPVFDRGGYFARVSQSRSYAVAVRIAGALPEGMYYGLGGATRSLRSAPAADGEGELLIVAGEGHRPGEGGSVAARYARLEEFARERFGATSVEHRWSAQDEIPEDGMPYVGRLWPRSGRVVTATGFKKWGLAFGIEAARMLVCDLVGRPDERAAPFRPGRFKPLRGGRKLAEHNAHAFARLAADRLRPLRGEAAELAPGEGSLIRDGHRILAAHRDDAGELHVVSARCTHLGCIVQWNDGERSWDCPCHGSRFAPTGEVLEGPAVASLERRDPPS
jgi:glycine/D-amino acid oxidase-like deaminating enzyme/nitrite reductase/ring-hydroxylating ferredoxin subunit